MATKRKNMISGLWKDITPICLKHSQENIKMEVGVAPHNVYVYECPICKKDKTPNIVSMKEFERMVNSLIDQLMEDGSVCLKNYSWQKNFIKYKVLEHNVRNDSMLIGMENMRGDRI